MTTTTPPTPPAAVVGLPAVTALARLEIRYASRNPVLWLAAAVAAVLSWSPLLDGMAPETTQPWDPFLRLDWAVGPLFLGAFVAANWAALRERPATTAELFSNTPARRWERTAGLLAAAVVPAGLAAVVQVAQYVLLLRTDGVPIGAGPWTTTLDPTPLELINAPLAAGCAFVGGVAVARLVRSRAFGAVGGFVAFSVPYVVPGTLVSAPFGLFAFSRSAVSSADLGPEVSAAEEAQWPAVYPPDPDGSGFIGMGRDLGFYGLHLVVVVGLTLALAGVALARSDRDRRSRLVVLGGSAVLVVGVVVQVVVRESAREWLGVL